MTILEQNPEPLVHGGGHRTFRDGALALPQRDGLQLFVHLELGGELEQVVVRVRAGRDHEDNRHGAGGVLRTKNT